MSDPAVLVGFGACTSVGLDLASTDAAVRANLNDFGESSWLRSRQTGEPLTVARLSTLPNGLPGLERMRRMGLIAAAEALRPWLDRPESAGAAIGVILAVPPWRPGFSREARQPFAQSILSTLPCPVDRRRSGMIITGHDGGLHALATAARFVLDKSITVCLVIGLDSYIDIDLLEYLDGIGRLKREDVPTGLIPGEGAGAVLVSRKAKADAAGLKSDVALVSAGRAEEPDPWYSGRPTLGKGLTEAMRAAFANPSLPAEVAEVAYCDMNGEAWRPDEWAYAYLRTADHHGHPLDLRTPATSWGDVGAASGPLLACVAARELVRRPGPPAAALLWAASDMKPVRAACLLRRLDEVPPRS